MSVSNYIIGMDAFVPYLPHAGPEVANPAERIERIVNRCVSLGFTSFDFSIHEPLLEVFGRARRRYGDQLVLYGNPSWSCGVHLEGVELVTIRGRIVATLSQRHPEVSVGIRSAPLPTARKKWWLDFDSDVAPLTDHEISLIALDERKFLGRLELVAELGTAAILGADYADWLVLLGRFDVLMRMYTLAAKRLPVFSISHFTESVLPTLDMAPVSGHFVPFGKYSVFFHHEAVADTARRCEKPVAAVFSLLRGKRPVDRVASMLALPATSFPEAKLMVGVESESDVEALSSLARRAAWVSDPERSLHPACPPAASASG